MRITRDSNFDINNALTVNSKYVFGSRGQLDKSRTNPGMLANKNNRKPYDSIDEIGKNHQEQETYITESKINLRPSSYDNRDSKYSSPSSPAFPNQPNFSFQPQLSIDTQKSHLQSPNSINSPISSPVKDSIYKDEKTPTQALMNARIHDNPSTTFVEIADLKRLLSDVVMNSTYVAKHLNDKDRLLKTILEIKDGFNSRIEDLMELKTWLKDGDVGFVVLNQLLFTLHSTAWNLNKKFLKALNGASPDKSSSPIAKLPTNTRILFNRSKITAFTGKLNEAWNQLMLQIAILLAEKSSKSSAVAALHVTQLAIATGAADWQDITLDDAGLLYIQGDRYLFGFGVAQSYEIAHRRYLVAARAGLPEAINMLGLMAENGLGQSKDMSLAFKWYKEASALGCLDSINNLGRIYQNGIGCAVELTAAREYYFNAANKGHLDASCNYGHFLEHGLGGEVNLQAAFQWYKLAADKNYAKGQNALGSIYHNGIQGYLEKNQEEAISLFRQAAAQGNSHALNNLGICYEEGKGVAKDLGIAKQFYKEAASLKHPKATNNYGWILLLEHHYDEAIQYFHLAMAVGDSDAAYNLGVLYETGVVHLNQRILSADMFMALKYFLIASKSNHTPSDLRLGTIYLVSEEYQDYPKALSYLTRAANNDDADAMNLLGQMKELGIGNDESSIPDYISARFWYKKAYHKGHLGAMFNLGNLYECGVGGVEKDFERALKFYSKAATQGHQDSIDRLIDLREMEDDE